MSRVTPAERQALRGLLDHGSPKAAAHALGKSPRTIEQQLATAQARLGVDSRYAAIRKVFLESDAG